MLGNIQKFAIIQKSNLLAYLRGKKSKNMEQSSNPATEVVAESAKAQPEEEKPQLRLFTTLCQKCVKLKITLRLYVSS